MPDRAVGYDSSSHSEPSCECAWLFRFVSPKVTPMSVVARFLLGWTALSVVVGPLVGTLLHRRQLDLAAVPAPTLVPAH
jgi:hypothetical protein